MIFDQMLTLTDTLSWLLYVSVFAAAGIFAHMSVSRNKKLFALAAVLLPTLLGGLRYMVGVDYSSYVEKLQLLSGMNVLSYLSSNLSNMFEPTFYIFSRLSLATSEQAVIFFSITSGLIVLLYFLASKRYSPQHTGLMFFLILMTVFPKDLSGVRQGVAVAICFFAVSFIAGKKPWRYLGLVCIAGLFHYSAFLMLAVYPLYRIFYARWPSIRSNLYLFKTTSLALIGFFSAVLLIKNLAHVPFFGRYAYLFTPEKLAIVSSPNILAKMVPVLLVAPFYSRLVKQDKSNAFFFLMSVMSVVLTGLGFFAGFVYRLANYFIPFYSILFVRAIDTMDSSRKKRYATAAIVIYAIAHFTGSNLIRNSYGLFPYQFIF